MQRRLAAVVAMDVAGYSRLTASDDTGTHRALRADIDRVIGPTIREYVGRLDRSKADDVLAEFPSVGSAVDAIVAIRDRLKDEGSPLEWRTGLTAGEVCHDGRMLFGDTVNMAFRLQALAPPGGAVMTEAARGYLAARNDLELRPLGPRHLKNMGPVKTYALAAETGQRLRLTRLIGRGVASVVSCCLAVFLMLKLMMPGFAMYDAAPHVAVLPFLSNGAASDRPYLRSLHHEVANGLVGTRMLEVSADRKGAKYTVNGDLVSDAGRSVFYLDVTEPNRGRMLLGQGFPVDQDLPPDVLAEDIVAFIGSHWDLIVANPGVLEMEYFWAQRGLAARNRLDREGIRRALGYYRTATEDAAFAEAHAQLALTHVTAVHLGFADRADTALKDAYLAAQRATGVEPGSAFAQAVLGITLVFRRDFDAAEEALLTARRLDPENADVAHLVGWGLTYLGHAAEGLSLMREAAGRTHMLPEWGPLHIGEAQLQLGDPAEAAATLDAMGWKPSAARLLLAEAYEAQGAHQTTKAQLAAFRGRLPMVSGARLKTMAPFRDESALERRLDMLTRAP
ncbi:MAG: hypothetical protein AAFV62_05655 [Pseudomonadota bacterium]